MADNAKITLQKITRDESKKVNNLVWGKLPDGKPDKTNPVLEKEYTVITDLTLGKLMLGYMSAITVQDYAKDLKDLIAMINANKRLQLVYIERGKVTFACNRVQFLTVLNNRLAECGYIVGSTVNEKEEIFGDSVE
jgi:hypothetical protein